MKWLEETLGMELSNGAQWALLFLVLAVTLAILFWTFRMIFGYGGGVFTGQDIVSFALVVVGAELSGLLPRLIKRGTPK